MRSWLKVLAHAALGGAAAGLATYSGGAITVKTAIAPAIASALTSVLSLFAHPPTSQ